MTTRNLFIACCALLPLLSAFSTFAETAPKSQTNGSRLNALDASVVRGSIVYRTYCVLCHGSSGQGDGRAAKRYMPPPANLVMSRVNDAYKEAIIRGGGQVVGRSPFMPPWGEELSNEQIRDLIAYLRVIAETSAPSTPEPQKSTP
ncbi:MAG: cytochrome c [Betaproteobacteria bacterium]|nr:cytochrome c [Betaproteobacteria bacterium]